MRIHLLSLLAVATLSACGPSGPAVMEFVEITPPRPRLGEVVTVRFRLLDERGVPQAGTTVDFKLESEKAGVTLAPTSATSLKGTGYAETQVVATNRVNSIIVVATAGDRTVTSPPITFAGTVPNGRQFTFQCGEISGDASGGRHAIGAYDQARNLIAGVKLECTAHAGDRNGDGVEGALISFMTEAGTIGPSESTLADVIGNGTILYKTSLPLPLEVPPTTFTWTPPNDDFHTGSYVAPLWLEPFHWVENPLTLAMVKPNARIYTLQEPRRPDPIRLKPDSAERMQNNPRDNLVTLIAVTSGEEGFTDFNNNGVYDPGEPFDDLTEPFVDMDDSGTWEDGEPFIDINGNGQWDGKNGMWDSNTLIWVEEKIIWTGIPAAEDTFDIVPGVAGHRKVFAPVDPARLEMKCPTGSTTCHAAGMPLPGYPDILGPVGVTAYIADPWFNGMAQNGDGDGCQILVEDESPVKVASRLNAGIKFTYPPGDYLSFTIADKRDPMAPPTEQVPKRTPPIGFANTIFCDYTASPVKGHIVRVSVGNVVGTIE